ncbi:MAG: GNAT family N-acetyltransferase [Deltaproteobacteria bacterium]|nr:GNAT family N-acetyltransferase [Deltaproteobacteria bacterium]
MEQTNPPIADHGTGLTCVPTAKPRYSGRRGPILNAQELSIEVVSAISSVDEGEWNALLGEGDDVSPFVEWRFLSAFEQARTLGHSAGWIPQIPLVRRAGRLVAAAPLYVKFHSHGEFVFDFAWADFANRHGLRYYPKLLTAVPFTPVTGRRLLTHPAEDHRALLEVLGKILVELCAHLELSSAHVNFALDDEIDALVAIGFIERYDVQYHWRRGPQERSFDDYLQRFTSKKRNQIKRERRTVAEQGLEILTLSGDALAEPALFELAYRIYRSTVDKFAWGRRYLNHDLFKIWFDRMRDQILFVVARPVDRKDEVVAGAINFAKGRRLYGRYWGALVEARFLHFNVCYYHGIEQCFARGLDVFEPGAQGEHKRVRGFAPTLVKSAHYIRDASFREVLSHHLAAERRMMVDRIDAQEDGEDHFGADASSM